MWQDGSNIPASLLRITKLNSPSSLNVDKVENEESISDGDLDRIVGIADSSELEVTTFMHLVVDFVHNYLFFYSYF